MIRFTIRDMLWLTVVVAVCCTWFVHVRSIRLAELRRSEEQLQQAKASLQKKWEEARRLGIQLTPLPYEN
jgi:hypothetical protein